MTKLGLTKKYTTYPKYKDSGVLWIGEIPKDWELVPLKSLFKRVKRTKHPKETLLSVYRDYGVIEKASRDDNHNKPSEDLSPYQLVLPGDLVTNKMKTWQGSIAISKLRGIVSPAYYILEPQTKQNPAYYHYLLRSDRYIAHYENISKGIRVNQWDLDYGQLKNSAVVIPSEGEQKKIADFLDEKTATIDHIIEKKQRQIELLKEKRAALINHAVTKGLDPKVKFVDSDIEWIGNMPAEWNIEKLKFIAPLRTTKSSKKIHGYPYIGLENIESATGRLVDGNEKDNSESVVSVFYKGDVLYSKLRPNLAKVFLPDFDGISTGELLPLMPTDGKILPGYLFYKLISRDFTTKVCDSVYGSKMPRANWSFIGNLSITYPSVSEQAQIISFLDQKIQLIDKASELVHLSIKIMSEFKSSLISHAVTGKIKI